MTTTERLTVGTRVIFDGELWQVTALDGSSARLERAGKPSVHILVSALLTAPGFRLASDIGPDLQALGPTFDSMGADEYRSMLDTEGHVREVLTGYRSGDSARPLPGEPRPEYLPSQPKMSRYEAKAHELGSSVRSFRRLVQEYEIHGLSGLVDARSHRSSSSTGRVDPKWIDAALEVLAEHVDASQPSVQHIMDRTNARVRAGHGTMVKLPSPATAYRVLAELTRGQQAFSGTSAKQKRSIASRPATPYGRLRSSRLGQYIVLDTSPLDVFAMNPMTLQWVGLQLTVAMELGTRSITGLRLSPVSAKSVDAALVLYETIHPGSRSHTSTGLLPYAGVPDTVFIPGEEGDRAAARPDPGLPGTAPETVIIDHGKMYMSEHVRAVCERLGIGVQPARTYTATDKAPLERFFGSLRTQLLEELPGYKGPDVYSRGREVESLAYYFSHELESIIREWVTTKYHPILHRGLRDSSVPGLELSPNEMWELTAARSGHLQIPRRADLVFDFLPVAWRRVQHYGVDLNKLRYDGHGLEGYRDVTSPYPRKDGKWPIRYDPEDVSKVYFQRPDDRTWTTLRWEHASDIPVPFSLDALQYARRLAATEHRHPDDRRALGELLDRWGASVLGNPTERRIALRMSEQRAQRLPALEEMSAIIPSDDGGETGSLGEEALLPAILRSEAVTGDDDGGDDFADDVDYYADAMAVGE